MPEINEELLRELKTLYRLFRSQMSNFQYDHTAQVIARAEGITPPQSVRVPFYGPDIGADGEIWLEAK